MGYLKTVVEVIVALFAVIGFYSAARMLSQKLYGSRALTLAIEIRREAEVLACESLIQEGLSQFLLVPSGRVVILTVSEWAEHPKLLEASKKYGVKILVIKE